MHQRAYQQFQQQCQQEWLARVAASIYISKPELPDRVLQPTFFPQIPIEPDLLGDPVTTIFLKDDLTSLKSVLEFKVRQVGQTFDLAKYTAI